MKYKLVIIFFLATNLGCKAQIFYGMVKDSADHKALDFVSVVLYNKQKQPICFQQTDSKGRFTISLEDRQKANSISFSILGYAKKTYAIEKYKNGQNIYLSQATTHIKEVTVKSKRLQLRTDTLVYSVAGFRQKQDRSIADVIAKMPGLDVDENGGIKFQGKAINKFYIEGMDLMGSKYAMASENLSADKVKSVEVLQNHQPIKSLKNIRFSDQAALNIVLTDEAKGVWNGTLEIGGGMPLQEGTPSDNVLRDCKIIGMNLARKNQSITMYKTNNTGKDIQHEILSLTRESALSDMPRNWVSHIGRTDANLKLERYNFNDTHIIASNWLSKLGKEQTLRLQSSYLYDRSTGCDYTHVAYTDILGKPIQEEENNAKMYRSELCTELQYNLNTSKNYINNLFLSSFDWNHDYSTSVLNGKNMTQRVEPHRIKLGNDFKLIRNFGKNKAFSMQALASYSQSPSKLLLIDHSIQKLNVTESFLDASTTFRHKIFGFNISYEANLYFNRQEAQLTLGQETKDYIEETSGELTPHINYAGLGGLELSTAIPMKLASYNLKQEGKTNLYVSPTFNIAYKFNATTNIRTGYRHSYSLYPFSLFSHLSYNNTYISTIEGNGKIAEIKMDKAWGEFNLGNPIVGLFYHLYIDYTRNGNVPLFCHSMNEESYNTKISEQHGNNHMWNLSSQIEKSMGLGKLNFSLGVDVLLNNYQMLIDETPTAYQSQYAKLHVEFSTLPTPLFSIEEKSSYIYSKQINKEDHALDSKSLRSFLHDLRIFFIPGNWQLEWKHELYHSNDNSVSTSLFSDIRISYKTKRHECSLLLSNIYGTKEFKRTYLAENYTQFSISQLRCREVLLKYSLYL